MDLVDDMEGRDEREIAVAQDWKRDGIGGFRLRLLVRLLDADRDGRDAALLVFGECSGQFADLEVAVGAPSASVEDEQDGTFRVERGEGHRFASEVQDAPVGDLLPDRNAGTRGERPDLVRRRRGGLHRCGGAFLGLGGRRAHCHQDRRDQRRCLPHFEPHDRLLFCDACTGSSSTHCSMRWNRSFKTGSGEYLKKVKATAREAPAAVASTYLLAVHPFTELVGPASGALLPASEVP